MTLKEAHEIQRRELMSLRAENARLKKLSSGLFPNEEKETLERHIRHLEQVIKTEKNRHQSSRDHCKLMDKRCEDLEMENLDLKDQVKLLTSENESLPSSALPFRKKVPNSRKPSSKKPGGQPGHRLHTASRLLPTKEPVFLPAPASFSVNPNIYTTGRTITKQLIDIQVTVNVRDYIADEYRNRITGARMHAAFPNGITNDVNYGPSVKALAFLLNNYYNVSISKTKQCIHDIPKGVVNLSAGTICNLSSEFSAATETDRAKIFSLLTHSDILYSDATVSNVNGTRKAVILCTDKEHVLYQHLDHKGRGRSFQNSRKKFQWCNCS